MRPSRIQVSSSATGQVSGREPRPISTSRQPVLPEICSSTPPSLLRILAGRIDLDPAAPVLALAGAAVEADDLGAAQRPGEAERQNGAVAQAAQVHLERGEHGQELVGEDRRLLDRRASVLAANAGEHRRDVAVAGVERRPELAVAPADPGEAALERRNARAGLGLRGEIESDDLRNLGGSSSKPLRRSQEANCRQSES